jgi:phage tail sheath protein FI
MAHCEKLGDRFALIDPDGGAEPNQVLAQASSPRSSYAALYYPWLVVSDPLGDPGAVISLPPSGHVAGVCARVDLDQGVQKPPANEVVNGAQGVARSLGPTDLGDLNEGRVNAIRALPGRGVRVYGSRTLARPAEPQWLYVNVRRLLLMIETAIDRQTQWAVHEPNSPRLQRALERVVRNFLDSLWRLGYLDGGSAQQAYSVVCDDTTNPPEDTNRGRVTCLVGVLPPAPAEFVVVRIGKTDGVPSAEVLPEGKEDV